MSEEDTLEQMSCSIRWLRSAPEPGDLHKALVLCALNSAGGYLDMSVLEKLGAVLDKAMRDLAIFRLIANGYVTISEKDGELAFQATEAGIAHAR